MEHLVQAYLVGFVLPPLGVLATETVEAQGVPRQSSVEVAASFLPVGKD